MPCSGEKNFPPPHFQPSIQPPASARVRSKASVTRSKPKNIYIRAAEPWGDIEFAVFPAGWRIAHNTPRVSPLQGSTQFWAHARPSTRKMPGDAASAASTRTHPPSKRPGTAAKSPPALQAHDGGPLAVSGTPPDGGQHTAHLG